MRLILRRVITISLTIFACFLLQTGVFSRFRIAGVVPNILIIITSFFGFMMGRRLGGIVGFVCGIIMDLYNSSLFGMYGLIFLLIGYMNGLLRKLFFGDDMKLPLFFVAVSDLLYGVIVFLIMFLRRSRYDFVFYFMNIMMPEMVYTICVTIPLYFCMDFIIRKMTDADSKRSTRKIG